ncbi:DUF2523 family protein [Kingella kingae]|uniref:DUF2523 family protein n=1 Tax=Kingella kingae TaxID=504 RepID=UPI00254FFA7A|nr:DUF2523 family protein [Kingella kingae]MDK4529094.1 DUF2523 family protein [Kingella kingae]MDK4564366.1 DUF2523 family protein [Kingella kingae]MDK4579055.1 DUF2523 family protein [Kingella kingae]MDK4627394.1 DUF2523 family protein [Kingella kingae]MDK4675138.1 DUF2523 family protein [Kingella kingae]
MNKILFSLLVWVITSTITRILIAFGVSIYSYDFASDFFDKVKTEFFSQYHQLPAITLQLLELSGLETSLEVMFSGLSFLVAWHSTTAGFRLVAR